MKRRTWRTLSVAGALVPITATATPPTITKQPGTLEVPSLNDVLGEAVCDGFDVGLVAVFGPGFQQISFSGKGRFDNFFTGPLTATLTNLDTHVSVTRSISGPFFTEKDGSLRGTGSSLVIEPRRFGGLRLVHGSVTFDVVSYGLHANLRAGTDVNLCGAID